MKRWQAFFDGGFLMCAFWWARTNINKVAEVLILGSERYALPAKRMNYLFGFFAFFIVSCGQSIATIPLLAKQDVAQTSIDHLVLCKTDWMYRGEMGLSTHYFPLTMDSIEEVANAFQVQKVANQVAETPASWFVFTVQHQNWMMTTPNQTFDRILGNGDYTPDRDIPLELYRALNEKDIKLVLYVNLYMKADAGVEKAMGGWPPSDTLVDNIAAVYREYSLRYGNKVVGWWVDGAGMPQYKNSPNRERWFSKIASALRAGNPNALVSISPGLQIGRYSPNSDFIAGESDDLKPVPTGRWLDGAQWHVWTFLGGWWGSNGTRFPDKELGDYMALVTSRGGVLTFDVGTRGITREGRPTKGRPTKGGVINKVTTPNFGYIDPAQIKQIKTIRKYLYPVTSVPLSNCVN